MKTNLDRTIESEQDAKDFLEELFANGEGFHTDDSAFDINWQELGKNPTHGEKKKIDKLMDLVHEYLPDPAGYVLDNRLF